MITCDKEDWHELIGTLRQTEERLAALNGGDFDKEAELSRQSIQAFRTTAAMLELSDLERAGAELENFLLSQVVPSRSMDSVAVFGFAIGSLVDQMRNVEKTGGTADIDIDEILEMLGPPAVMGGSGTLAEEDLPAQPGAEIPGAASDLDASSPAPEGELGLPRLNELVKSWGGELAVSPNGGSGGKYTLTFSGPAESLKKLEKLLCSPDPSSQFEETLVQDARIEKVISKGKEFMDAFSSGDMPKAQEILMTLSDQQYQSGLYKEIGGLARGLHDSIRSFLHTLDPSLKEIVETKIPDSGNRLEHMLELTEKAAITTLDHVEAMQDRLAVEAEQVLRLREVIGGLSAIGNPAGRKLGESAEIAGELESIIAQHRTDLDAILTAQDYQDLSGQIILKITKLLKDLEAKLVNLIRTFGVKTETGKAKEELYGPAHAGREDAVHSQDEVDSLLAEFGF